MILKKKVSAITAMMVLLGGVLCNSDNVAAMDSQKNTYTTPTDFLTNKLIDTVRDIKKKKKSNNMPKAGKPSVSNEDKQEAKNDEMTKKKTIKIKTDFSKAGSIFDNETAVNSLFSTLQELGWKNQDDTKEKEIKEIKKLMSECEQTVKMFDGKFKKLIEWTLDCTDKDITKKIMDEIIKNIEQSFPNQKIGIAVQSCDTCYTNLLFSKTEEYKKTFYQLITNESKNNSEIFLNSFFQQFEDDKLVQTRQAYNAFLKKFGDIIKNSERKRQNKNNKQAIQDYNTQKSNLDAVCKICKQTDDMKNFITFFKENNNNNENLFISFIAKQIVDNNICDILTKSGEIYDVFIRETGKQGTTKKTTDFFNGQKRVLQAALDGIQSTQQQGEEEEEEEGEE